MEERGKAPSASISTPRVLHIATRSVKGTRSEFEFGDLKVFCFFLCFFWGVTLPETNLLGQWLNFKLFGITYLVGKIKFKLFFSGSRTAEWVNSSRLKMDGWNTMVSFWGLAYFQRRTVRFRECKWVGEIFRWSGVTCLFLLMDWWWCLVYLDPKEDPCFDWKRRSTLFWRGLLVG